MTRAMQADAEAIIWGVRHAQGVVWFDSEAQARQEMQTMVASDARRHSGSRGKVRLLSRYIGTVETVENPYAQPSERES